jgi:hypothetical protein
MHRVSFATRRVNRAASIIRSSGGSSDESGDPRIISSFSSGRPNVSITADQGMPRDAAALQLRRTDDGRSERHVARWSSMLSG